MRPQTVAGPPSQSEEEENRVFLLVVGLGSQVLGILLETGGCAVVPQVQLVILSTTLLAVMLCGAICHVLLHVKQ